MNQGAFCNDLVFPGKGSVLVIERHRVEGLLSELNSVPEDNHQALVNKFMGLEAAYYPRVSD